MNFLSNLKSATAQATSHLLLRYIFFLGCLPSGFCAAEATAELLLATRSFIPLTFLISLSGTSLSRDLPGTS